MKQSTVVISIGRNIGTMPMAPQMWLEFKRAIGESLRLCRATVVQHPEYRWSMGMGEQVGVWDGVEEGAATFIAFVNDNMLTALEYSLGVDKQQFGQEAIGYICVPGTGHLL